MKRFFVGLLVVAFGLTNVALDGTSEPARAEAWPIFTEATLASGEAATKSGNDDGTTTGFGESEGSAGDEGSGSLSNSDGAEEEQGESAQPELLEFDAPLAPVAIAGAARVDAQLTAETGAWAVSGIPVTDGLALSYQWHMNGGDIVGAIANTFMPRPMDAGKQVSVTVTAVKDGFVSAEQKSLPTVVAKGSLTVQSVPTVSGTPRVGSKLSVSTKAWGPGITALSYEWLRNGITRVGIGASYTLVAADLGTQITVRVTGKQDGYDTATQNSKATVKIAAGVLSTKTPTVTGTVKVGMSLAANPGKWTAGTSHTYQWLRNGRAIKGAMKSSYKLVAADAATRITVKVTGKKLGYTTVGKTSTSRNVPRVISGYSVSFTGTMKIGYTVKAKTAAWKPAPVKVSYQWLRDGAAIKGATKASYKIASADAGKRLSLKVTGVRSGYYTEIRTSGAKAIPRRISAATPAISGSTQWGKTLIVKTGFWGPKGVALKYQWFRNGAAVPGKTGKTYSLASADIGKSITVRVTGAKAGYASEARTAKATAVVRYPSRYTPSGWSCPAWAPIKGNASSMIYHLPSGTFYSRTKPEECFASEGAARAAGYRASKR
ncbi:sunset domain-containing protein [Leucobacter salsicius]|uniref:sunset domain-containing protein n=1 Tax=Leucobacter salsicius TaxID=664638 RepID=UPI00034DB23F|nr:hypothetical protein [Leucobacter salsicius]